MVNVSVDIARDGSAPGKARRVVRRQAGALDAALVGDVTLLVSELVTNSVKYGADGTVRLRILSRAPAQVRVEVSDDGHAFVPAGRDRPLSDAGGWGLHLVERLADRWGVATGTSRVWFEIDRRATGAAAA